MASKGSLLTTLGTDTAWATKDVNRTARHLIFTNPSSLYTATHRASWLTPQHRKTSPNCNTYSTPSLSLSLSLFGPSYYVLKVHREIETGDFTPRPKINKISPKGKRYIQINVKYSSPWVLSLAHFNSSQYNSNTWFFYTRAGSRCGVGYLDCIYVMHEDVRVRTRMHNTLNFYDLCVGGCTIGIFLPYVV